MRITTFLFLLISLATRPSWGQAICQAGSHVGNVETSLLQRPIDLRDHIGSETLQLPTEGQAADASDRAKSYYKEGLALLHDFEFVNAIRAFNMAIREKPDFAMAYVGLARSYPQIGGSKEAQLAIAKAQNVAKGSSLSELEKAWVRAVSDKDETSASNLLSLGRNDPEVLSYFGWDMQQGERFLNKALEIDPKHVGANHYLAHIYENECKFDKAETHVKNFAEHASASPHAIHMQGHFLPKLGRWKDAEKVFQEADELSRRQMESEHTRPENDWNFPHNLTLLAATEKALGNKSKAEKLLKEKCTIQPFESNCLTLIEYYLSENRFSEAGKILDEKYYWVLHPPENASNTRTASAVLAKIYSGEVAVGSGDSKEAEEIQKSVQPAAQDLASGRNGLKFEVLKMKLALSKPLSDSEQDQIFSQVDKVLSECIFDGWSEGLSIAERIAKRANETGNTKLARRLGLRVANLEGQDVGSHTNIILSDGSR